MSEPTSSAESGIGDRAIMGLARGMGITGHTRVAGVVGWPVEHSVSPAMHNAAYAALGLDWCYLPFAVPPERLREAIAGVRALGLVGVNVTVPHKQALLPLMDELTPAAMAIGAANTVMVREGRLVGHNTDASGFLRALREVGCEPEGIPAVVLGAGGAARAVVYALLEVGAQVTVLNRTLERAEALARDLGRDAGGRVRAAPLDLATLRALAPQARLVVNATTVGMWRAGCGAEDGAGTTPSAVPSASPWPDALPFPSGALAYDLIYNPRETAFMRQARAAGVPAANGLGMLVHQGAEAFTLWTGVAAPVEVMARACVRALGGG